MNQRLEFNLIFCRSSHFPHAIQISYYIEKKLIIHSVLFELLEQWDRWKRHKVTAAVVANNDWLQYRTAKNWPRKKSELKICCVLTKIYKNQFSIFFPLFLVLFRTIIFVHLKEIYCTKFATHKIFSLLHSNKLLVNNGKWKFSLKIPCTSIIHILMSWLSFI